jgi:hypothetical protein
MALHPDDALERVEERRQQRAERVDQALWRRSAATAAYPARSTAASEA